MAIDRLLWSVGVLLVASGIVAALATRRRRHRAAKARNAADQWTFVDDLTQAAAGSLPHEAGEFSIPPR